MAFPQAASESNLLIQDPEQQAEAILEDLGENFDISPLMSRGMRGAARSSSLSSETPRPRLLIAACDRKC